MNMIKKIIAFVLTIVLGIALGIALNYGVLPDNNVEQTQYFEVELNVMTFNIRSIQNEPSNEYQWDNRKQSLAEQILEASPDIIGVQEVRYTQRLFLEEKLIGYKYIGRPDMSIQMAQVNMGGGTYIFYKEDRLQLIEDKFYWLSETPSKSSKGWDASSIRMAVFGKFLDKESNHTLVVGNTHLDNAGAISRSMGSQMILNTLAEYNLPCVFMGDFNIKEDNEVYKEFAKVLNDTKYTAKVSSGSVTFHGYGKYNEGNAIDFIFTSKDCFEVSEYKVINQKHNEIFTSDHYPVMARITLM